MQYLTPCFALLFTYLAAFSTWASSPDQVFVDGVAITDSSKMIQFEARARLLNSPSNNLYTYRLQDRSDDNGIPSHKRSCGDVWCSKRNQVIAPLALPDFALCSSSSNESHVINSGGSATLAQGQYQNVILNGGAKLEFTTSGGAYRMKDLIVNGGAKLTFSPGRYWLNSLTVNSGGEIILPESGMVQIFVKNNLVINGSANLNEGGDPNNLLIASYGSVNVNNPNRIAGYIYSKDNILINGDDVEIDGGLVGAQVQLMNDVVINYHAPNLNVLWQPDCDDTSALDLRYGRSSISSPTSYGATVTFSQPYEHPPLVFLMTPIDNFAPDDDGPVAAVLTSVTEEGFAWRRVDPPENKTPSQSFQSVDWVAVNPGEFTLSDGRKLVAGKVEVNNPQGLKQSDFVNVDMDSDLKVLITQLQTTRNDCWLTTLGVFNNRGIRLGLEANGASTNNQNRCMPGEIHRQHLQDETVAYLVTSEGGGIANINGQQVSYQFGLATNTTSTRGELPSTQCAYMNSYQSGRFNSPPVMVAGKNTRKGSDGGWVRRCAHTSNSFSMVVDEDQYQSPSRLHQTEDLSFVAFEYHDAVGVPGLEISALGNGLTCDIHEITLRATLDGQTDQTFAGSVNLSTSTNRGMWSIIDGKANGSLTPEPQTDDGSASYQFVASDRGEITLGLFHSPVGEVEITVADGALSASTTVSLSAYGLRGELDSTQDWGSNPHIANEPFSLILTAVGKDESGADCSPLTDYAGSKNIAFWTDYTEPNSGSRLLSVEGAVVGASEEDRTTIAVTFTDGESDAISLNYNDAGRLAINFWDEVGSIVDDSTVTLRGSNSADVLPAALVWIDVQSADGIQNSGGTAISGDKFVPAGQLFSGRLQAKTANCNDVADINCWAINFASDYRADLDMLLETPTAGKPGAVGIDETFPSWSNGGLSFSQLSWSEVGSIWLTGEVKQYLGWDVSTEDTDHLGLQLQAQQSVGRFYPAYYELMTHGGSLVPINSGCDVGSFTYTGATDSAAQHLAWQIVARNAAHAPVENYTQIHYKVGSVGQAWRASETSVDNRLWVATPDADNASAWKNGVINYPPLDDLTGRGLASGLTKSTTAEAPINNAIMQIFYQGPDGSVLRSQGGGFNCFDDGWCDLAVMPQLRHGRIFSPNSFGSELESIRVQPQLQYVDAFGQYVLNIEDDGCTAPLAGYWQSDSCTVGESALFAMNQEVGVSQRGLLQQRFDPSNPAKTGLVCYWYDHEAVPGVPSLLWLRDDWNADGALNASDDRAGSGEVSFGWFRQNDRVIYRRSIQ